VTVRLFEIETYVEPENTGRRDGFLRANLGSAARAQLAARHITHSRPIAEGFQFEKGPGDRQLRVVGMRKNSEHIELDRV
jgi:hypothetical protein